MGAPAFVDTKLQLQAEQVQSLTVGLVDTQVTRLLSAQTKCPLLRFSLNVHTHVVVHAHSVRRYMCHIYAYAVLDHSVGRCGTALVRVQAMPADPEDRSDVTRATRRRIDMLVRGQPGPRLATSRCMRTAAHALAIGRVGPVHATGGRCARGVCGGGGFGQGQPLRASA